MKNTALSNAVSDEVVGLIDDSPTWAELIERRVAECRTPLRPAGHWAGI